MDAQPVRRRSLVLGFSALIMQVPDSGTRRIWHSAGFFSLAETRRRGDGKAWGLEGARRKAQGARSKEHGAWRMGKGTHGAWHMVHGGALKQSSLGCQPEQNTLAACPTLARTKHAFRLSQSFAACESNSFPHFPTFPLSYLPTFLPTKHQEPRTKNSRTPPPWPS